MTYVKIVKPVKSPEGVVESRTPEEKEYKFTVFQSANSLFSDIEKQNKKSDKQEKKREIAARRLYANAAKINPITFK